MALSAYRGPVHQISRAGGPDHAVLCPRPQVRKSDWTLLRVSLALEKKKKNNHLKINLGNTVSIFHISLQTLNNFQAFLLLLLLLSQVYIYLFFSFQVLY